jgi:hypothetical protein
VGVAGLSGSVEGVGLDAMVKGDNGSRRRKPKTRAPSVFVYGVRFGCVRMVWAVGCGLWAGAMSASGKRTEGLGQCISTSHLALAQDRLAKNPPIHGDETA